MSDPPRTTPTGRRPTPSTRPRSSAWAKSTSARGFAPTRRAVEIPGDPQRAYPVIQVAGTNGKTSTSRMIESLLYPSPSPTSA